MHYMKLMGSTSHHQFDGIALMNIFSHPSQLLLPNRRQGNQPGVTAVFLTFSIILRNFSTQHRPLCCPNPEILIHCQHCRSSFATSDHHNCCFNPEMGLHFQHCGSPFATTKFHLPPSPTSQFESANYRTTTTRRRYHTNKAENMRMMIVYRY